MSKKKKVAAGKTGKKSPVKKVAGKVVKVIKKSATVAKKAVAKKPVKKLLKAKSTPSSSKNKSSAKSSKPAKKLGTVAKTIFKKVAKAVKNKLHHSEPAKKPLNGSSAKAVSKPALIKNDKSTKVQPKPALVAAKPEKVVARKAELPKEKVNGVPKLAFAGNGKTVVDEKPRKNPEPVPSKNGKKGEVLAITNTIPVKQKSEISASKIASISYSITNPVRKTDSYAIKPEKEPNGKFELEFVVHASAEMLYEFLSTPSGLSEWFCDDLNIRNGIYTFIWDDQLQQARLLKTVDQQLVRFQWVDKTDGSYFEFRIQRDDLTNDISLIITDFAESVSDRESSKLLWNSQVEKLMHVIGSIF